MPTKSSSSPPAGHAVDAHGAAVIDPTENVKALTEASVKRLDDLNTMRDRLTDQKIHFQEKIDTLREEHYREIRLMESDRVDKIRSVDVANAAATAAQLLSAVTTLATTAQATAETLRNQVAATAAAVASQTERVVNPIIERIALLEKSSYTGAGKQAVTDPAMADLVVEMRKLAAYRDAGTGKSAGINASWVLGVGVLAALGTIIGIVSAVVVLTRH